MKTSHTITLDKDKLLDQIKCMREIAVKDSWQFDYDADVDELVFGKAYMPRDSFLFNVNDELNLFVSPDSTVSGVFIEYFGVNFIDHNEELKPVMPVLEAVGSSEIVNEKSAQQAKDALKNELIADAFKSLFVRTQFTAVI